MTDCFTSFPSPSRVVLYGGSHGGFVVLHLASKHPTFYRCVVSRNGVVNAATKMSTTDIQNWRYDGDVASVKFLSPGPGLLKILFTFFTVCNISSDHLFLTY